MSEKHFRQYNISNDNIMSGDKCQMLHDRKHMPDDI